MLPKCCLLLLFFVLLSCTNATSNKSTLLSMDTAKNYIAYVAPAIDSGNRSSKFNLMVSDKEQKILVVMSSNAPKYPELTIDKAPASDISIIATEYSVKYKYYIVSFKYSSKDDSIEDISFKVNGVLQNIKATIHFGSRVVMKFVPNVVSNSPPFALSEQSVNLSILGNDIESTYPFIASIYGKGVTVKTQTCSFNKTIKTCEIKYFINQGVNNPQIIAVSSATGNLVYYPLFCELSSGRGFKFDSPIVALDTNYVNSNLGYSYCVSKDSNMLIDFTSPTSDIMVFTQVTPNGQLAIKNPEGDDFIYRKENLIESMSISNANLAVHILTAKVRVNGIDYEEPVATLIDKNKSNMFLTDYNKTPIANILVVPANHIINFQLQMYHIPIEISDVTIDAKLVDGNNSEITRDIINRIIPSRVNYSRGYRINDNYGVIPININTTALPDITDSIVLKIQFQTIVSDDANERNKIVYPFPNTVHMDDDYLTLVIVPDQKGAL
jgi:hypothetical protein